MNFINSGLIVKAAGHWEAVGYERNTCRHQNGNPNNKIERSKPGRLQQCWAEDVKWELFPDSIKAVRDFPLMQITL